MNFTRRKVIGAAGAAAVTAALPGRAFAQGSGPVKIGMSMPQTGSLGAGGQAALLALRMWVEDVNQKGGLLGRKVDFIVYDDQTNPANTPGIYTKLLDVDKVDLLIAPYGTVPTAPQSRNATVSESIAIKFPGEGSAWKMRSSKICFAIACVMILRAWTQTSLLPDACRGESNRTRARSRRKPDLL